MEQRKDFLRLVVDRDRQCPGIRGVYLVTDGGNDLPGRVRAALTGGVTVLQYRDKCGDSAQQRREGRQLKELCVEFGVTFIVNDDLELARDLDADGVHLGQEDGSIVEARELLGPRKLIGISTHSLEEARRAQDAGADYIGFGAIYPTRSKQISYLPGPAGLAAVRPHVTLPIVAIGGIDRDNAGRLIDAGADAVAVISAVLDTTSPAIAAAELALLFNRARPWPRGSVLTVAGSDSGGGAGIQADLKTITLLGSYGSSVLTALTAQNTRGVSGIFGLPPTFVAEQLEAVLADIPTDVVKSGMLFSAGIIEAVADKLAEFGRLLLVADPVMVAKGGASLIDREAVDTFRERLLPLAYLVTPNIPEAERLTGLNIADETGMEAAGQALLAMGARNVLMKGGHLPGSDAVDLLLDGVSVRRYPAPRILSTNTHGTGCTYASAIATFLAQGLPLPEAVHRAKEFITAAIRLARPLGKGHGPVNHLLAALEIRDHGTEPGER